MRCVVTCFVALSLGICTFFFGHKDAKAQGIEAVLGLATATVGAFTVDKLFENINQSLDQAQSKVESSGNRLLFSGVDQSRQMLKQLADTLASERDKTFTQLSDQRKLALWDLYSVSQKLKEGAADEFAKSVVQVNNLLANVRFIGKDVTFLIVRVMPTVFQQNGVSNNPIRVYGVGFGTDQANKKFARNVKVGGQEIPTDQIAVKEWGIEIFLNKGSFSNQWKADEYARVPMVLKSTITSPGSWWCSWAGCKTTKTYSAKYDIDLYPTDPAKLAALQRGEQEVPTGQQAWVKISVTLPNMHNQGHDATTTGAPVSAGVGWKWDHYDASQQHDSFINLSGNGGPFTTNHHCDFTVDHSTATCTVNNSGHSVIWQFGVLKKRYHFVQTNLPNLDWEMRPGESQILQVPTAAKSVWVEGTLPTGQKIGPIPLIPPGGNALDAVSCTGGAVLGDKRSFTCVMREPL